MEMNRRSYGYQRSRGRSDFKDRSGIINSKMAANMLLQLMACLVILLGMLYVRYNSGDIAGTVSAYTVKILSEDIDFVKVYTDSKEFWIRLFTADAIGDETVPGSDNPDAQTGDTPANSADTAAADTPAAPDETTQDEITEAGGTADAEVGDTNIQTVE